jgi:hypothetical protein
MSTLSIAAYFPFRRVRIASQSVAAQVDLAMINVVPDGWFRPVCHICGRQAPGQFSANAQSREAGQRS